MTLLSIELLLIASLTALSCTLPGTLLVLRGSALMSDAISHAVLLGIASMFLIIPRLDSPLLILGATLTGIALVMLVEYSTNTQKLKMDAALGLTFPLFFSIGVIIISTYARNAHLDTDMVLLGELAFAPFNRVIINGADYGPYALWITAGTSLLHLGIISIFFKEWHIALFDRQQAQLLGFKPQYLYYLLTCITSLSSVASFNIVGSLVVVALMIIPAATASLCSRHFSDLLITSVGLSIASAWGGYALSIVLNTSIAGSIACVAGLLFIITLFFEPRTGIIQRIRNHYATRHAHALQILDTFIASTNTNISAEVIAERLNWPLSYTQTIIKLYEQEVRN